MSMSQYVDPLTTTLLFYLRGKLPIHSHVFHKYMHALLRHIIRHHMWPASSVKKVQPKHKRHARCRCYNRLMQWGLFDQTCTCILSTHTFSYSCFAVNSSVYPPYYIDYLRLFETDKYICRITTKARNRYFYNRCCQLRVNFSHMPKQHRIIAYGRFHGSGKPFHPM